MNPRVLAAMTNGHGLITRPQALDAGLSPASIMSLVRRGEWIAVRRGVYADAELWNSLDRWRGRPRLRGRAAHLTMRRAHVMSHDSAAHELGLDILAPVEPLVHITRPGFTSAWTEYGVKHHLARYRPDQVVAVEGIDVLDLARTAVDIADEGAESIGESLGRQMVAELGIGTIETQFHVRLDDGRVARCDLRVGRHVFEFDGRKKYRRRDRGGLAEGDEGRVVWEEKKRERLVVAAGLGCSRIIWEDFWGAQRERAKARLLAEYDATVARFGTALTPEQVAFNAMMKQRRRTA